jgi:glycosyltransferase involved in cell wall biosynthesis
MGKRRILIVAVCVDGTDTGEAWSAHQWVKRLSERHDVTLLTMGKAGRPTASSQLPDTRVVEITEPPVPARLQRFNDMLRPSYLGFYLWARAVLRSWRKRGLEFDLVHQLSPLAPRYPCPAAGGPWPLVMGPLGGSLPTAAGFAAEVRSGAWYTNLRRLDGWRLRWDPWLRHSLATAEVVIGVAPYMREVLSAVPIRRFELLSETGVERLPEPPAPRSDAPGVLRLLYVGRLVRTKGLRDAIRALARAQLPGLTLDVVGEGEEREPCQAEAAALGVAERVRFHGRLPRAEVDRFYAASDAFLFPSFREPSGNVVMEALSWGLPVVTADAGGPGYVVDETCGLKVRPETPEQFAEGLAQCLRRLALEPGLRAALSRGARARIAAIALWERKIEWMDRLYDSVLEGRRGGVP